jgi:CelD/BcsL family acetyltransferase involved in cellulose biosynthesis
MPRPDSFCSARAGGPIAGWDELRLSGVSPLWATSFAAAGAWVSVRSEQRSFSVDLQALRVAGRDALSAMNANTRQQIRRARRLYGERGCVAIASVEGEPARRAALAELVTLHQARWQARGAAGSFASPVFRRLVEELVEHGGPAGDVEILRATAGDRTIGVLLNLLSEGEAANYLGAFRPEDDNRLKPGLVTHALAIEHHLARGSRVYDLLAGDARYKASLAAPRDDMIWLSIRPPTLRAQGLAGIGRVLGRLERWRSGNASPSG